MAVWSWRARVSAAVNPAGPMYETMEVKELRIHVEMEMVERLLKDGGFDVWGMGGE
jgi:hypothetical protein